MKVLLLAFLVVIQASAFAEIQKSETDKVCASINASEVRAYENIIKRMNKNVIDPSEYQSDEDGLQRFLDEVGIKYFSAKEISTPHSDEGAANCGVSELVPPTCSWKNSAAVLSVLDKIRAEIKAPITFRNWWRPGCYNSMVGGAKESDHLLSKAFDFDFQSSKDRAIAQKIICEELWKKNENIQIGIGCQSLHIGLGSPKGKRYWTYPGLYDESCKVKTLDNCWDL